MRHVDLLKNIGICTILSLLGSCSYNPSPLKMQAEGGYSSDLTSDESSDSDDESHDRKNLTQEVQDLATQSKEYMSPEGIKYAKGGGISNRIEHILQHQFSSALTPHADIVSFIDGIFKQISLIEAPYHRSRYANIALAGNITIHDREYKVLKSYNGNTYRYTIKPLGALEEYPFTGVKEVAMVYGYQLCMGRDNHIITFLPY